jgi:phosphatidylserine/phosphatidylglycerophosphate/cardiolipin synthase-like enzyme
MRDRSTHNGLTLKAYAGTTGVMLAFNVRTSLRAGLLGFAVEREGPEPGRIRWLQGLLRFPYQPRDLEIPVDSKIAPIQKFRWSDYSVYPSSPYRYKLYGVYGSPDRLRLRTGPEVSIVTESLHQGPHQIIFNRAAAASQAYRQKFKNANPDDPEQQKARDWLSRGLRERLLQFFDQALDHTWALDIAIYEIELPEVVELLQQALQRGVRLRLVFHARPNDPQTEINKQMLAPLPEAIRVPRQTSAIFHHKFCVLSKIGEEDSRQPIAVLTGSTNFTGQAVYRQANVIHIIEHAEIAARYAQLFARLFQGDAPRETKQYINTFFPVTSGEVPQAVFSPRSRLTDLQEVVAIVNRAQSDLLFCTSFHIHQDIELALLGHPDSTVIRYGLQNTRTHITGIHRQGTFVTPTFLDDGLEGFLKESFAGHEGGIFIHLKTIVADFTTTRPTIITGSNNFSTNASANNDENMLFLGHETAVADTYACEMMRLYDHYRFRFNQASKQNRSPEERLILTPDDSWTNRYFKPDSLLCQERIRFSKK